MNVLACLGGRRSLSPVGGGHDGVRDRAPADYDSLVVACRLSRRRCSASPGDDAVLLWCDADTGPRAVGCSCHAYNTNRSHRTRCGGLRPSGLTRPTQRGQCIIPARRIFDSFGRTARRYYTVVCARPPHQTRARSPSAHAVPPACHPGTHETRPWLADSRPRRDGLAWLVPTIRSP